MVTVTRDGVRHMIRDLLVGITLSGDLIDVHTTGDNSHVVPTDTQKNTVFAFAKEEPVGAIEEFALRLGRHFTDEFAPITRARVRIESVEWERIELAGKPHDHAFRSAGSEKRVAIAVCESGGRLGGFRSPGSGRPEEHRLRIPRLHQGPVHDAQGDDRPHPGDGGHGPLASRGHHRRLGRFLRGGANRVARALCRHPQPVPPADALPDGHAA